jgi:hypothetical protein
MSAPPPPEPRIVERDGNIVRIVAGDIEVIAEMLRIGEELVLDRMSIDGSGPGTIGLSKLRELGREFAISQGAHVLRIRGTTRTTGASPGKVPREIVIRV